jgi:exopolysaccharide biosynthesis protein
MLERLKLSPILLLLAAVSVSCEKDSVAQAPVVIESPLTQKITDSAGVVAQVFNDTLFEVTPGIMETDIHYLSSEGYSMHAFILEIDTKHPGLKLKAGTPYNASAYAMQTVPDMARYLETGSTEVMAAVNADFFNTSTGEPRGIFVKDGKVIKTTRAKARSATFKGIKKTG